MLLTKELFSTYGARLFNVVFKATAPNVKDPVLDFSLIVLLGVYLF